MTIQIKSKMFMKEIDSMIEKEAHDYAAYYCNRYNNDRNDHSPHNDCEYCKPFYHYFIKTAKSDENIRTLKHNYVMKTLRQKYPDAITCQFKFIVNEDDEYIHISNISIIPIHFLRLTSLDLDEYIKLHPLSFENKLDEIKNDNHIVWMNKDLEDEDRIEAFIYNRITNNITMLNMNPDNMLFYPITDLAKEHLKIINEI